MNKIYIKCLLTVIIVFTFSSCSFFKKLTGDSKDKTDSVSTKTTQTEKKISGEPYYLGRCIFPTDKTGIIFEDHYTFSKGPFNWNKDTTKTYEAYSSYIESALKKNGLYKEGKTEYIINEYKPEFEKLTNIKPGDKFNISSDKDVKQSEVTGYYINMDDIIGGGPIFYIILKSNEKDSLNEARFLCTKNTGVTKVNSKGITDKDKLKKFKSFIWDKVKNVKITDEAANNKSTPLEGIGDEDIKVYEGSFTEKGKTQYLVSYRKQISFEAFASGIWIMDENGKVISTVSEMREKDFNYSVVEFIADCDGDGLYEITTNDGYYEGSCTNIMKFENGKFINYATVMCFGV